MATDKDTTNLIPLGPCSIIFGDVNLGHTQGGTDIRIDSRWKQILADDYGNTPIDDFERGAVIEVDVTLAQYDIEQLEISIPNYVRQVGDRVNFGDKTGDSIIKSELVIIPEEASELQFTIYKAAVINQVLIYFDQEGEKVLRVTFRAYIDETRVIGDRLFRIGDLVYDFLVEADGGGVIGIQTEDVPFDIQITARDINGDIAINFSGTVDITSDDTMTTGGGTTGAFTNGVLAGYSIEMQDVGESTLTATFTGGSETGDSNAFAVFKSVILRENFENTNYDLPGWTEHTSGGCTLDPDASIPGTPPVFSGVQCLECTTIGAGQNAYIRKNFGDNPICYVRAYVYVESRGFGNGEELILLNLEDSTINAAARLLLVGVAGNMRLKFRYLNFGGYVSRVSGVNLSLETWYRFEFKYDRTNGAVQYLINGSNQGSWAIIITFRTPRYIEAGIQDGEGGGTHLYVDRVAIDDAGWIGSG